MRFCVSTRSWVLQHVAKAHFENNDYRKAEEVLSVAVGMAPEPLGGSDVCSGYY